MDTDQDTITDEARISRAFGRMPYMGGQLRSPRPVGGEGYHAWTPALIADNLERLADILDGVAERDNETAEELRQIRADLAGFGRTFGRAVGIAKGR